MKGTKIVEDNILVCPRQWTARFSSFRNRCVSLNYWTGKYAGVGEYPFPSGHSEHPQASAGCKLTS